MRKLILLTALLASNLQAFCQNDIKATDTLVYTPKYLMELFVSDLTQCDQDRIALDSVKHEVGKKDITIGRQSGMIDSYKTQIKDLVNFNDSLSAQVVSLMLDKDSTQKKLKRSRNFWIMTATLSAATAIFVHYNWKNSYIEFDN